MAIYQLAADASKVPMIIVDTQDLSSKDGSALQRQVTHPKANQSSILNFTYTCNVTGNILAVITNPA